MTTPAPAPQWSLRLNRVASIALPIGAIGSLVLFFRLARNTPAILIFLYTGWILLPFAGVMFARSRMARKSVMAGAIMQATALFLSVKSLIVYAGASLLPSAPRPAAVFLITPLAAWFVIAAAYALAAWQARKSPSRSN